MVDGDENEDNKDDESLRSGVRIRFLHDEACADNFSDTPPEYVSDRHGSAPRK